MSEKGKVLLVDDQSNILRALERVLDNDKYQVVSTVDPQKAIEYIKSDDFDVIISDQNMPQMSGIDLLSYSKKCSPYTSRILLTASDDINTAARAINDVGIFYFISKPWNNDKIIEIIDNAIIKKRESYKQNQTFETLLSDKYKWSATVNELEDQLNASAQSIIKSLLKVIESKDESLYKHAMRVSDYAITIATRMSLSEERIINLKYASWFHDIGKIAIRDSIIYKNNKLDDMEFNEIKNHPVIGADIISELGFLKQVSDIILQHHENLDGTGYPNKLKDKNILLEAKILAIADVFDALTTDRVYHKGLNKEEAFEIIDKRRGQQLDSNILDILYSNIVIQ